jgi:hypothetical protein
MIAPFCMLILSLEYDDHQSPKNALVLVLVPIYRGRQFLPLFAVLARALTKLHDPARAVRVLLLTNIKSLVV